MVLGYRKAPLNSKRFPPRPQPFIGGDLRRKFIFFSLTTSVGSLALFFVPLCLFLLNNYKIFKNLAFDVRPDIVVNLEQETFWLIMFALCSAVILVGIVIYITYNMARELTQPLQRVTAHMSKITHTSFMKTLDVDETEPLSDFLKNYNSLIQSFQRDFKNELEHLRKIQVDPQNREAYKSWRFLIDSRERRLGREKSAEALSISSDVKSDGSDSERRAS
jgi:methyl-accepting chemotaxis protein